MAKTAVVAIGGTTGSVRHIVDASLDPVYSVNHTPYGEPWNAQGSSPMPFGFTGEWQDPNELLFLRARYYNSAQAAFLSLDPLEGGLNNVGAINRYGYVYGDPVNFVDPSGLFSCSDNTDILAACGELRVAVERARDAGILHPGVIDFLDALSNRNRSTNENRTFGFFEEYAESLFNLRMELYPNPALNVSTYDSCTSVPTTSTEYVPSIRSLIRVFASLVHIVARIGETGRTTALGDFASNIGRGTLLIRLLAQTNSPGVGNTPSTGNLMDLGSQVSVATIVHELGHAVDRVGGQYSLSRPLSLLLVPQDTGGALDANGNTRYIGYGSNFSTGSLVRILIQTGMLGRARGPGSDPTNETGGEIFPDMFMNWVLADNYTDNGSIYEITDLPGWDCSASSPYPDYNINQANAKSAYTEVAVMRLLDGNGSISDQQQFVDTVNDAMVRGTLTLPCS